MSEAAAMTRTAPATRAALILADQANALQKNIPWLIIGNVFGTAACALIVVFYGGTLRGPVGAWLAAQWLLSAMSFWQAMRIRRRPASPRNAARRLRANTIGITIDGLLWMVGLPLLWPAGNLEPQWLIVLMATGAVGGALLALNAWLPAFHGFVLPCVTGIFAVSLWEASTVGFVFAGGNILFGLTSSRFAASMHETLMNSLRARYDVAELAASLQIQKDRAEEANLAKSRFLAAASHDLRQPVHALTLFVDALAAQPPGPEADRMLARISATVGSLGEMFDALLDVSKLDAGVVAVDARTFDLRSMIENLCAQEAQVAAARGLALRVNARPVPVNTDPLLLERIVRNLMANALRYTDRGGVLITVRQRGSEAVVRVVDTGIGIAPERQAEVFEEFVQLHNPERDRNKGLGLGLAIVRRLTRLLGVSLTLRSHPGHGTTFTLRLPVAENDARPAESPTPVAHLAAAPAAGELLLVIDDDADVRAGMCTLLAGWGYRVIDAAGIADLLPQLRSVQQVPVLILSDYRLRGEETGAQAIERLHFEYNDDIPAILITGDTAPERLIEARASGHLLLHKPLAPRVLREKMAVLLTDPAAGTAPPV